MVDTNQPMSGPKIKPSDEAQIWVTYGIGFLGAVLLAFVVLGAFIWHVVGTHLSFN